MVGVSLRDHKPLEAPSIMLRHLGGEVHLMMMEPNITAKQIAEYLNVSFDGVRYHIKKLRADGKVKRESSTKSGKWVVMK